MTQSMHPEGSPEDLSLAQLQALYRMGQAVTATLDLPVVLQTILDEVSTLIGADSVAVLLLEDAKTLRFAALSGAAASRLQGFQMPATAGIAGEVVKSGYSLWLKGEAVRKQIFTEAEDVSCYQGQVLLAVPLQIDGRLIGVLEAAHSDESFFTESDLYMLETAANWVAVALKNAQLYDARRQNERRYRTLAEASPAGIFHADKNGRIIYTNQRWQSLLEKAAPNEWLEAIVAEERAVVAAEWQAARTAGEPFEREFQVALAEGMAKWVLLQVQPQHDEAGEISGFVGILTDISDRKRVQTSLYRAQKLESLSVLAGGIAHDFSNLLVGMLGQLSVALAKLPSASPVSVHLNKAIVAAQRASDLTRLMLAFSGHGRFETNPVDLNELLQQTWSEVEPIVSSDITLETSLADELPLVEADADQLRSVLTNLLVNALEAMEDGPGTITITTTAKVVQAGDSHLWQQTGDPLSPGNYIWVTVRDSGVGMDAATLGRLFEPFFSTKFTGRGLGLAAALGVVRGHRGSLWVESEPGAGSAFHVLLPALAPTAAVQNAAVAPQKRSGLVLVIDDETAVLDAVADILAIEEIETLTANRGQTGVALFAAHQEEIDLVLLDVSMPGMDGIETLAALKEVNEAVPVIMASGYHQTSLSPEVREQIVGFIQKPFDVATLLEIVQAVVSG